MGTGPSHPVTQAETDDAVDRPHENGTQQPVVLVQTQNEVHPRPGQDHHDLPPDTEVPTKRKKTLSTQTTAEKPAALPCRRSTRLQNRRLRPWMQPRPNQGKKQHEDEKEKEGIVQEKKEKEEEEEAATTTPAPGSGSTTDQVAHNDPAQVVDRADNHHHHHHHLHHESTAVHDGKAKAKTRPSNSFTSSGASASSAAGEKRKIVDALPSLGSINENNHDPIFNDDEEAEEEEEKEHPSPPTAKKHAAAKQGSSDDAQREIIDLTLDDNEDAETADPTKIVSHLLQGGSVAVMETAVTETAGVVPPILNSVMENPNPLLQSVHGFYVKKAHRTISNSMILGLYQEHQEHYYYYHLLVHDCTDHPNQSKIFLGSFPTQQEAEAMLEITFLGSFPTQQEAEAMLEITYRIIITGAENLNLHVLRAAIQANQRGHVGMPPIILPNQCLSVCFFSDSLEWHIYYRQNEDSATVHPCIPWLLAKCQVFSEAVSICNHVNYLLDLPFYYQNPGRILEVLNNSSHSTHAAIMEKQKLRFTEENIRCMLMHSNAQVDVRSAGMSMQNNNNNSSNNTFQERQILTSSTTNLDNHGRNTHLGMFPYPETAPRAIQQSQQPQPMSNDRTTMKEEYD